MRRHRRRGQSMIEFSLLAPIFFMALIAVFDFARATYTYAALAGAAREGGREAIVASFATSASHDSDVLGAVQQFGINLNIAPAPCVHGYNTAPTIRVPSTSNTGWIYIRAGSSSPGAPNSPAAQAAGTGGPTCITSIPAGAGTFPLMIEVVYNFQPYTPFAAQFMGSGIVMDVWSTMYTEF